MHPIHPSRTAPLCEACRHVDDESFYARPRCNHPASPASPVNGKATQDCRAQRAPISAQELVGGALPRCGPAGSWFEAFTCATCKDRGSTRPLYGRAARACPDCAAPAPAGA